MNRLALVKLGLGAIGVVVWGYGARTDDPRVRLAGMIVLGIAVALRLLPRAVRDRLEGRHRAPADTQS
ncbi:MAG: hypothetical protein KGL93_02235 [Gemmatimonadota bacterium]|nr:hypothetical protein [Gemmatimonadota bacterium]HEU4988339.1 hypothetical protein [Gemmatimonadaceae bacterium]